MQLSLKGKLVGGFVVAAGIMAIGGVTALSTAETQQNLKVATDQLLPTIRQMGLIVEARSAVLSAERSLLMDLNEKAAAAEKKRIGGRWQQADKAFKLIGEVPKSPEVEQHFSSGLSRSGQLSQAFGSRDRG